MCEALVVSALDVETAEMMEEMNDAFGEMFQTVGGFLDLPVIVIVGLFVLFLVGIIIFAVVLVKHASKKNQSARTTFVPFAAESMKEDLPLPEKNTGNQCIYCGKEIQPGSEYCNHCGKKQVRLYTKVFNRKNMQNEEFISMINTWLASNKRIANVKCDMMTNTGYGLLVNQYFLDSVALKFELFSKPNENQYAMVELKRYGLTQTSTRDLLEEWKAHNPTAKVVKTAGGTTMRGKPGMDLVNGLGANNNAQLFVLFKVPRKPSTVPAEHSGTV